MPLNYIGEDGQRRDAELWEDILATGDDAAAREVTRAVLTELGMDPTLIDPKTPPGAS